LSFDSQDAMNALGSHRVYIHGIHKIKSFVSEGVTRTSQPLRYGELNASAAPQFLITVRKYLAND